MTFLARTHRGFSHRVGFAAGLTLALFVASTPSSAQGDPPPPAFSTPRDLTIFTAVAGQTVSFQVSASDPGNSVTLTSSNLPGGSTDLGQHPLPSGATFLQTSTGSTVQGTFSWTPTASPSQAGFYTIAFFANDINGQSAIQVTINVIASLPACSLTVTDTGDIGGTVASGNPTSLRQAIDCANSNPGKPFQAITFSIPGGGAQTITPTTAALPNITVPVIIDGYSQPGANPNTSLSSDNATLLIVLNGSSVASGGCSPGSPPATGLMILGGSKSIIQGLVINNFCTGISISGNLVRIRGNFMGTDSSGEVAQPNVNDGVDIVGAIFNTIGGNSPGARNLISGNGSNGVGLFSTLPPGCGAAPRPACSSPSSTLIQGNFIGTDATGLNPLGNGTLPNPAIPHSGSGEGVVVLDGSNNNSIESNVVSYNGSGGVEMDVSGLNPSGSLGVPSHNKVGGNTVAFNGRNGVRVDYGAGNTISQNSIYGNGDPSSGIKLGTTEGVDLNQNCNSTPGGGNNSQNFPVLNPNPLTNTASGSPIIGTLNSVPNTTFTIEFFANNPAAVPVALEDAEPGVAAADPIGFGEGQTYIGSTTVTTNASCNASFSFTPPTLAPGQVVTTTATNTSTGDTSEFSDWGNKVTVSSNANPSAYGQSVTITASLSPGNYPYSVIGPLLSLVPSPLPSSPGSATFQEGATVLGGPTPLTSLWQASFSISNLSPGNHTITAYFTDTNIPPTFISSIGMFTLTVNDTPPAFTAPPNQTLTATSAAGAVAAYTTPTATDVKDGTDPVTCTPASGSTFPIATTTVTCTSTNSSSMTTTHTFTVTVLDAPPSFAAPANITTTATGAAGATATYTTPTATDYKDGTDPVNCTPLSGSIFPIATTTVTCTSTNSSSMTTTHTFTVTVVDAAPAFTPPPNQTLTAISASGATATYTTPTATDFKDGTDPVTCAPASGSTFPIATTTVTCSSTNSSSMTTTHTFTVTVVIASGGPQSSVNFNMQSTPAGATLWFNSIFKLNGGTPVPGSHLYVTAGTIAYGATIVQVPDAVITFTAAGVTATATFNTVGNFWNITVPYSFGDNVFMAGLEYTLPVSIPNNTATTWSASFATDVPGGLKINWQGAAAAYSTFGSYNSLGVKSLHSNSGDSYPNGDQAGTPENFKPNLVSGGTGGGGSNYTGSYSNTSAVQP